MLGFVLATLFAYFMPALARVLWWCQRNQRSRWYSDDCSATGLLPDVASHSSAAVYVLSARTSGLKGALATHSWIVIHKPGAQTYHRYDKMGWGDIIWKDGFAADALWFGHPPVIEHRLECSAAAAVIPAIEAAVASYPHQDPGSYRAWPGPNSNSFVAHVLRAVPQLGRMPATAVGRDFTRGVSLVWRADLRQWDLSLTAYAGLAIGPRVFELRLLGLVGGFDLDRGALLVPGVGSIVIGWQRVPANRSTMEPDALAADI